MKTAPPLAKVTWDPRLHLVHNALGTHTAVSRVQGGQLKAKREARGPPSPLPGHSARA